MPVRFSRSRRHQPGAGLSWVGELMGHLDLVAKAEILPTEGLGAKGVCLCGLSPPAA